MTHGSIMTTPFDRFLSCKYISCCGAGLKGNCYVGMIEAFECYFRKHMNMSWSEWVKANIKGTCGSSAGALLALILQLGIDAATAKRIVTPLVSNVRQLLPHPDIGVLISHYGIEKGNVIRQIISDALTARGLTPDITFQCMYDLTRIEFACTGTNLRTGKPVYFHRSTHPEMRVKDAVFISACVPLMFAPLEYNGDIYVDGALTANLPIYFPIEETAVFAVEPVDQRHVKGWVDYMSAIVGLGVDAQKPLERSIIAKAGCDLTVRTYPELRDREPMDMSMNAATMQELHTLGFYQVHKLIRSEMDAVAILLVTTMKLVLDIVTSHEDARVFAPDT